LPFRRLAEVPRRDWDERYVRDSMLGRDKVAVLTEDEAAIDALAELSQSNIQRGLVVSDGRLVGLLSISDLGRALEAPPRRRRAVQAG
jgi:CBS domain-containing protein